MSEEPEFQVLVGCNPFGTEIRYSLNGGRDWETADMMQLALTGQKRILNAIMEKIKDGPMELKLLAIKLAEPRHEAKMRGNRWLPE